MAAPPTSNPVFNADDFEVQTSSGGLDETMANARYIRKTVDDSTDYSLTVRNGFWCQSVDAPPDSTSISLGYNADSITIGGSNAALVTTIHNATTEGLLTAVNGIQTSTLTSTGDLNIGGSLTSSGLIYANGNISMGSALINLGASIGTRTALHLGFLKQNTPAAVTFNASNLNTPLWNGEYTIGVWIVSIQLQFTVNAAVSNIKIQLGSTLGGSDYASVSQLTATTLPTTVCLSTVISLAAIATLYVGAVGTYTGAAPSLTAAFSWVVLTRIG